MVPQEGERTNITINPSELPKAVEAVYCNATVDNKPIYLILDSGSAGSVMSKSFLQQLGRKIESASTITMINIQGGRSRPLGRVNNIPLQINGVEVPINVDITESTDYYIVAGNDWLTKCRGRLYWDCQKFTFIWNNKEYQIPMTCWEKPQFDHF
jgi:hypothetical protein